MLYQLGFEYIMLPSNAMPAKMCLWSCDGVVHVHLQVYLHVHFHVFLLAGLLAKKKPEKT